MLIREEYKEFKLYSYDIKYINIGKNIIDKNYNIIKKLKDTKRNYVVEIEVDKENFILKEPRNEYIIPQRKIMTVLKKGEALSTLININDRIYKDNILEYSKPYLAIVKRSKGMINYSALLMEKSNGIIKTDIRTKEKIVNLMINIHKKGFYHGDFNPSNFLIDKEDEIKIIDTQGKKMIFGNYRAHYDMLTMKLDSYIEMRYPYKKNIFYYLALFVKKIKKLYFIEKIKEVKKELRERGWKI